MNLLLATIMLVVGTMGSSVPRDLPEGQGPSRNMYKLLSMWSGSYNNNKQVWLDRANSDFDQHDSLQFIFKPVYIEALRDKIVMYTQQSINGVFARSHIFIVSEDNFGVIHMQGLNVTNLGSHDPYDRADTNFSDVTYQAVPPRPTCESLYYPIDDQVFIGAIPLCKNGSSEEITNYSKVFTCHSLTVSLGSAFLPEKKGILPYILVKDYSFPLLPHMINNREARVPSPCYYVPNV